MAMPVKPAAGRTRVDPDDAPELTEAFFARADVFEGDNLVRRGRPPLAEKKQQVVTLRLDPTVLAGLRATGPGWQTKANAVLKAWLANQKRHRKRRAQPPRERGA
jgi:uncharacterized protein (DUF4415 family)